MNTRVEFKKICRFGAGGGIRPANWVMVDPTPTNSVLSELALISTGLRFRLVADSLAASDLPASCFVGESATSDSWAQELRQPKRHLLSFSKAPLGGESLLAAVLPVRSLQAVRCGAGAPTRTSKLEMAARPMSCLRPTSGAFQNGRPLELATWPHAQ